MMETDESDNPSSSSDSSIRNWLRSDSDEDSSNESESDDDSIFSQESADSQTSQANRHRSYREIEIPYLDPNLRESYYGTTYEYEYSSSDEKEENEDVTLSEEENQEYTPRISNRQNDPSQERNRRRRGPERVEDEMSEEQRRDVSTEDRMEDVADEGETPGRQNTEEMDYELESQDYEPQMPAGTDDTDPTPLKPEEISRTTIFSAKVKEDEIEKVDKDMGTYQGLLRIGCWNQQNRFLKEAMTQLMVAKHFNFLSIQETGSAINTTQRQIIEASAPYIQKYAYEPTFTKYQATFVDRETLECSKRRKEVQSLHDG